MKIRLIAATAIATASFPFTALASQDTIGTNGIHSAGLLGADGQALTGAGIGIGQVESQRPGDADVGDSLSHRNTKVNPAAVYERTQPLPPPNPPPADSNPINIEGSHAEWVAGVMISTDDSSTGVATGAQLYAAGDKPDQFFDREAAITAQLIASQVLPGNDHIRAINMSFVVPLDDDNSLDGNQLLTQFVDWSAADDDILYVQAGRERSTPVENAIPTDNYNGITVAASSKIGNVYRQVAQLNIPSQQLVGSNEGPRTAISLIAPGEDIEMRGLGNILASNAANDGTSFAAPHVTGTVALLQQYAVQQNGQPRWVNARSRRHEVMKAVLLNSADKIIDDGTFTIPGHSQPSPIGTFLGMERTVVDWGPNHDGINPQNWFQSEAYGDEPFAAPSYIPLDDQMGAGHLNAKRALQQYMSGEYDSDSTPVPVVGWDYGHTSGAGDFNKYVISQSLLGGSFISISMAWDRVVNFQNDANHDGEYDDGDTFKTHSDFPLPADDVINDLDVYLVPFGQTADDAIAAGLSNDSTIEHVFFEIPTTGQYEIWVNQWDNEANMDGQDYAIAWWAKAATSPAASGDYSGNGTVGPEDYTVWKSHFGTGFAAADGNGNGVVDAADYTVWRDHLGQMVGSGSASAVPEPTAALLILLGVGCAGTRVRDERRFRLPARNRG